MTYALSLVGIALIKEEEGLRLDSYHCPSGLLTIGYGHVMKPGDSNEITEGRAEILFSEDTQLVLNELWKENKKLKQNQVDALVSFIYNIGIGAWRGSRVRHLLDTGANNLIANQMRRWIHDSYGRELPGLVARRNREANLFTKASI